MAQTVYCVKPASQGLDPLNISTRRLKHKETSFRPTRMTNAPVGSAQNTVPLITHGICQGMQDPEQIVAAGTTSDLYAAKSCPRRAHTHPVILFSHSHCQSHSHSHHINCAA